MTGYKFYILDVFAEDKYCGNQLAVFMDTSKQLTDIEMQKIAREINFSETTFINSGKKSSHGFDVRIFTPKQEIPFAGHPSLGTAFIIIHEMLNNSSDDVTLNLKAGKIPVKFENGIFKMKQIFPEFGQIHNTEMISSIINVEPDDIDERFPIREVSTGLSTLIVPLKNIETLKRVKINKEEYFSYVKDIQSKLILVFSPDVKDSSLDLRVRVFVDWFGIPEDPATGSGNGCLAGYLVKHKYFGTDKINIVLGQGNEIDRPSKLYLEAENKTDGINVFVGGKVIKVSEGTWNA